MKPNYRYVGERKSKKEQNIQQTIEFILSKNYGSTLTHIELGKLLGYNIDDEAEYKKYKLIMARIKNFLLQYGYVLKGINGIGYYILKPTQVSKHCYRTYIKKSARMLDKSCFVLDRTEKDGMEKDRLEEINNLIALNTNLIKEMENTVKESAYYSRKNYYDSLEE